jgi:hypothetical protein
VWRGSPSHRGIGWRKQEPAKIKRRKNLLERWGRRCKPDSNIRMHQHNQRGLFFLPSNMKKTKKKFQNVFFFRSAKFFFPISLKAAWPGSSIWISQQKTGGLSSAAGHSD